MDEKGWPVRYVDYQKPSSGFKCIEGGWVVEFDTETENDDYYELFEKIPMVGSAVCASPGLVMGFLAKDVISVIKSLPRNPEKHHK